MANKYIASYKALARGPSASWSVSFYANDDSAAEAVASVIDGVVAAKRVGLTKSIFFDNTGTYPDGTTLTMTSIIADVNEDVFKFRARNFLESITDWSLMSALLHGNAITLDGADLAALASPPALPNTLLAVASVRNVTPVEKSSGGL